MSGCAAGERRSGLHNFSTTVQSSRALHTLLLWLLLQEGHEVVAVPDGATALSELESGGYDLAVLEHDLAHVSGSEVLRSLLQKGRWIPPVVMVSSLMSPLDVKEALSRGVALHIAKPFNRLELLAAVTSLLEGSKTLRSQRKAESPVSAWPITSWCTSAVPS